MRALAVATAAALAAMGCHGRSPPPPPPPVDAATLTPNAQVDDLAREEVDAELAASPITATWLGAHAGDDRLDDLSAEAQAREQARERALLDRVEAIPDDALDEPHRLDRALLLRDLRLALFERAELRPFERSPVAYVALFSSAIYELLAKEFAPLPDRLRSVTARIGRARPFFEEARRNLKNPPELEARKAIELAQSARAFIAETLPRAVAAVGDERLQSDFRVAQSEALRALDDFLGWLQKDLLPRAHGELPLGRDRLLAWLRASEAIDLPPDAATALLAGAERELKAAGKRFEDAARAVAPGKTPLEAVRAVEDDHPTAEQLLPAATATLDQLLAFARERRLVTPPDPKPKVVEMPPYLWGFLLGSFPGPLETRPNPLFYVDPVNRSWDRKTRDEHLRALNRTQIALTETHEVLGHDAQQDAARRAATPIERVAVDEALAGGWAAWIDEQVAEAGFAVAPGSPPPASATPDARLRLLQRREALLAIARLAAALRFHAAGAKLDDLVKLFADEGWLEDAVARREAERVAYDPAVLRAGLGLLAIAHLRDEAQAARGDRFSLGAFDDALLAHGALPLGLARRVVLGETGNALY